MTNTDENLTYAEWIAHVPSPIISSPLFAEMIMSNWKRLAPDIPFVEWLESQIDNDTEETS